MRPNTCQQHARNNDNQRIKKVERTIPSSGFMNDEADKEKIGQNLQRSLKPVLPPQREQNHKEEREAIPQKHSTDEEPHGQRGRIELGDRQLDGEEKGQDKNADPNQPHQPIAFIERRLHGDNVSRFHGLKGFKVSRRSPLETLKPFSL